MRVRIYTIFAAACFLCLGCISTAAQDPTPVPVLVDEFPTTVNCEDANARMDNFFIELSNNPSDRGVIVIYESPAKKRSAWYRENLLSNFIKFRKFDRDRIAFVRGPVRENANTQFWRVPPGAGDPELNSGDGSTAPPEPAPPTKPYIYATRFSDGLPECHVPMFDLEAYAEVVKEADGNRGNIVIGAGSRSAFRADEKEIRAELEGYGLPRSRIRTFFKKVKPNAAMEFIELWVLPGK